MRGALALVAALALAVPFAASLAAQACVVGTVIGHLREPVPAARVWLERDGEVLAKGFADGSGRFVFGNVPFGRVDVRATLPGHTIGFDHCTTSAAAPEAFVEPRVHDAGRVRGRVVDADGAPVAGAFVLTQSDLQFDWYIKERCCEARSDDDGCFVVEHVLLGPTTLALWAPGKQLLEQRLHVRGDEQCDVVLRAADGASLRFVLEGASPEQLAAARVTMRVSRGSSGFSLPEGLTRPELDAHGVARVDGLPLDVKPSTIFVTVPGAAVEPGKVQLEAPAGDGERSREVRFRVVEQPPVGLRGHLRDEQGRPLVDRAITCLRGWPLPSVTVRTDRDGAWSMRTHRVDNMRLSFVLPDRERALKGALEQGVANTVRLSPPFPDDIELVAVPATVLRARLVDLDGRPISDLTVRLRGLGQQSGGMLVNSDGDGVVEFTGLDGTEPAGLELVVEGRSGFGRSEPFHLESRRDVDAGRIVVDVGRIVVQPAGSVGGVVKDAAGEPVPGARVSIRWCDPKNGDQTGSGLIETVCDADGRFRFVGLTPRGWRLSVYPLGEVRDEVAGPWFELGVGEHASATLSIGEGR